MEYDVKLLKHIVDNAPHGATHVEDSHLPTTCKKTYRYFVLEDYRWYGLSSVAKVNLHELPCFTRRLEDIKMILNRCNNG